MLGQTLPVPPGGPSITIRRAKQEDAPVCGRICFDAFYGISTKHGFPPDFPSPDVAIGLLSTMFSHPEFYCVVAESDPACRNAEELSGQNITVLAHQCHDDLKPDDVSSCMTEGWRPDAAETMFSWSLDRPGIACASLSQAEAPTSPR